MKLPMPQLLAATLAASSALAQTAATSGPNPNEEPVVLDVFNVHGEDDPYRAAYSSAGTRYDMPLKELPAQVDVFTTQFLRDTGVTDLRQALEYTGGIQLTLGSAADSPDAGTIIIRGQDAQGPQKDGFPRIFPADAITLGRVDVIKGPGGPLYGTSAIGGVVNYSSPEPLPRPTYYFKQTFGDHEFVRTEMQTTGTLTRDRKLSFVLSAAYQRADAVMGSGYHPMYAFHERLTVAPTLQYRFNAATKVRVSFEYQYLDRDNLGGSGAPSSSLISMLDNFKDAAGNPYGMLIKGQNRVTFQNSDNRYLMVPDIENFRFDGPDTYSKQHNYAQTLRFDHAFTRDFGFWAGYNLQVHRVKARSFSIALRSWNDANIPQSIRQDPKFIALLRGPTPTPNAAGVYTPDAFHQVLDIRPNNVINDQFQYSPDWKAELYDHMTLGPTDHRLIAGIYYNRMRAGDQTPQYAFNYTTSAWENLPENVILSRFRSPTDYTSVKRWDDVTFAQYPVSPLSQGGYLPTTMAFFFTRNLYANLDSRFFHNRLITLVGILNTRDDRESRVYAANGDFLWSATPAPIAGYPAGFMRTKPIDKTLPTFSASFLVTPDITVFANGQKTIQPGVSFSRTNGNGEPMGPAYGTNEEAGVHTEVWQKKIAFNASYFLITSRDVPMGLPYAYNNILTDPLTGATITNGFGAYVPSDTESKGYELKMDFRVTHNLRFNASFTSNANRLVRLGDTGKPGSPDPTIRAAQDAFAATNPSDAFLIGTNPTGYSKHEAVGYVKYDFTGRLKGLWMFAAAKYQGSRTQTQYSLTTPTLAKPYSTPVAYTAFVPKAITYDFNAGYKTHVFGRAAEIVLNIVNVTDYEDFRANYFNPPRTIHLSAAFDF